MGHAIHVIGSLGGVGEGLGLAVFGEAEPQPLLLGLLAELAELLEAFLAELEGGEVVSLLLGGLLVDGVL